MLTVLGLVLVILGTSLFATAAVGLVRLRDVYCRSSAIATAAGLGVSLVLLGLFCFAPSWPSALKVCVAVLLQLLTSAIGSMAIARAGYLRGSPFYKPLVTDELGSDPAITPR
ncbi:MAG: monovalent cation/H(+) antiporter subunit G [Luteococcus japonicus]